MSTLQRVSHSGRRWLSLAGNAKEACPGGPPVVREVQFRAELDPLFRILRSKEFRFAIASDIRPEAWSILAGRR